MKYVLILPVFLFLAISCKSVKTASVDKTYKGNNSPVQQTNTGKCPTCNTYK